MSSRLKNVFIGLFVVIALISTVYIIIFLEPKIGDGGKILRVRFSNIAGINVGTRVTLAGKPVGEVTKIEVVKGARKNPTDLLGRVYYYQLILEVDSSVVVYNTDEVTLVTTGLMGEKSIGIIPKAPKKGVKSVDISGQIIYAQSVEPIENMIHQISNLADKMEVAISDIDVWFVENQDNLSNAVTSFSNAMAQIDEMVESVNKEKLINEMKIATNNFSSNMQLIEKSLNEIQDDELIAKFNVILENFAETSDYINRDGTEILTNVNKITKDIADGKGTIGRLVSEDDFYLQMTTILTKVDTLMNDINHYGVLFQYNKQWQRLRTKRASLLESLNTPKEFKNYFENEIDNVTTSLSRISILIEQANKPCEKERILQSKAFQSDFASLLRQVEHLLDSLKLYNEDLTETINQDN